MFGSKGGTQTGHCGPLNVKFVVSFLTLKSSGLLRTFSFINGKKCIRLVSNKLRLEKLGPFLLPYLLRNSLHVADQGAKVFQGFQKEFPVIYALRQLHRVLPGGAQRGLQFYFMFAVLQALFPFSRMSLFYLKTCTPVLSGPISRDIAIVSLRYPLSRDTFSAIPANHQQGAIPPPFGALFLHRHISAIPHFATYRAIFVRYPRKISTKEFCDTIAESIARYEKYRCWAS